MILKNRVLWGAMIFALSASAAPAATDESVYAGLVWELGQKATLAPSVTVGVRSLHVDSGNGLDGADLSLRVRLKDGFAFDSSRLVYVGGERDLMGNVGVGYSFANKEVLGTAAIQGPHSRLGADYLLQSRSVKPFIELNTLSKPDSVVIPAVPVPPVFGPV